MDLKANPKPTLDPATLHRLGSAPPTGAAEAPGKASFTLAVNISLIERVLLGLVAFFALAGLAVALLVHVGGLKSAFHFIPLFDLDDEGNVPNWFSSSLLFFCAVLLALVAGREAAGERRFLKRWLLLAVVFLYISADEAVTLHEYLNLALMPAASISGLFYFAWVLPGSAAVALLAAFYWPLVKALPRSVRRRTLVAAAVYVGGALVTEFGLGLWAAKVSDDDLVYALIQALQESLEMTGLVVFAGALLRLLAGGGGRLRIGLGAG